MTYELAQLHSYVRFYQTVATRLAASWDATLRAHGAAREVLVPFAGPLAPVGSPALAAATAETPAPPPLLAELWQPTDTDALSGINDVYEVVGRFAFQGDDDVNLRRVQALVAGARNEVAQQRARLADLRRLPDEARACSANLQATEAARLDASKRERMTAFEPLAEVLRMRARQTLDVMSKVVLPDLARAETASDEYGKYAARLQQVYETCLPFLRQAVAGLFGFVALEVPSSWPDQLPIVAVLPPELVTVPPADSEELLEARKSLAALAQEDAQLAEEKERVATAGSRAEGEAAGCARMDNEAAADIERVSAVVEYLKLEEKLAATARSSAAYEQEKAARVRETGAALARLRKAETALATIDAEQKQRTADVAAHDAALVETERDEPVLFGKDAWKERVADLRSRAELLRVAYAQRAAAQNQLKMEISSLSVDVQTREQEGALTDRAIADSKAREKALEATLAEMGKKLGRHRPVGMTSAVATNELLALGRARAELGERLARATAELRRAKEETVRILKRKKQIEEEQQRTHAMVESAQIAATQGQGEALRQLAKERRAAVERHVGEVLGNLQKSLAAVDAVFVDPARGALDRAAATGEDVAKVVETKAAELDPIVAELVSEIEPELAAQEATLAQIQREFCEAAPQACKSAWG